MSRSQSLAAYSINIWNFEEREREVLSDFADEEDFLALLSDFLSILQVKPSHDKQKQQLLTVEILKIDKKGRTLCGIIETGEYGSESKLRDADTHHRLQTED